jgi:hypothetical protein
MSWVVETNQSWYPTGVGNYRRTIPRAEQHRVAGRFAAKADALIEIDRLWQLATKHNRQGDLSIWLATDPDRWKERERLRP